MSTPRVASRQAEAPPEINSLYVVAAWVPRRETIVVGALGPVTFARGWHAYVGSARRGRDARVARHMRADKPLRWHADYLFTRHPAARAWLLDTPLSECELAGRLRAAGAPGRGGAPGRPTAADGVPVAAAARFGASDCDCPGHLLHAPRLDELQAALAVVAAHGSRRQPGLADHRGGWT
jgi:Uri superfamily endonuclease